MTHVVVGSGPAGVSCASALLDRGASVRMVDGGVHLEPVRAERVAAMASQSSSDWSAEDLSLIREGMSSSSEGVLLKRTYGSDFPYRDADETLGLRITGAGVKASLARGGLSNVWGAAMLPYIDRDLVDWPFRAERLAPHYRDVTAITGLSGDVDGLANEFPLHSDQPDSLRLSRQAAALFDRLRRHEHGLRAAGISFGKSRLALTASGTADRKPCIYCGLCMYGCPHGLIYNSTASVDRLRRNPRFEYQPGFIVDWVREDETGVSITGRDTLGRSTATLRCERVYLAAGVIPTTQILLRSLEAYDQPVRMLDSQYFLIPLAMASGAENVVEERLHTLSQLFVEIHDAAISPYTVHLQVYTYNDLIGQAIRNAFGPLAGTLEPLTRRLENRLVVVQGYLHSAHSATMQMRLRRTSDAIGHVLDVTGEPRLVSRRAVKCVARRLLRCARPLGGVALTPLMKIAEPGRGFHTGGSFPMRDAPRDFECDVLGRPSGLRRVHAVDATVLPSIPATTITFTVMANAHRIGAESLSL